MRALVCLCLGIVAACGGSGSAAPPSTSPAGGCGGHALSCDAVVERYLEDPEEAPLVAMDLDNECANGRQDACDALGVFLLIGEEVAREPSRALALLSAHCDRGGLSACRRVASYVSTTAAGPEDAAGLSAAGKGCDGGDADSCVAAGELVRAGRGRERDIATAVAFYRRGCEAGSDLGCRRVADHHVGTDDRDSLVTLYRGMCDSDNARGCTMLAEVFARDDDATELAEVGPLFERGCAGGDQDGCIRAAIAMVRGDFGIAPDTERSRALLEAACAAEDARGCAWLGRLSELGIGHRPDLTRAHDLYEQACAGRNGLACYRLGVAEREHRGRVDQTRVVDYFRRACDAGDVPRACGSLGAAYDAGRGVEQDHAAAEPLYHSACDGGHPDSCMRLADLVTDDESRAAAYRERACSLRLVEDRCDKRSVPPRSYPGRVTSARGPGAPREGSFCAIVFDARAEGGRCRVTVRCGGEALYGGSTEGWASCEVTPTDIRATDRRTTPFDGTPQIALDTAAGTLRIGDVSRRPRARFVEIEVQPQRAE